VNTNSAIMRQIMQTAIMLEAEWRQVLQGSVSKGAKEDESSTGRVSAVGFHHVTARCCLVHVLKLMNRLFNFLIFFFGGGGGCHEPRITETVDTESVDVEACLYLICLN
jgi:hypothetical protein